AHAARRRMHTPVVLQHHWLRVTRTLCLLRSAEQFRPDSRLLSRDSPPLVSGTQSPQPAATHVGALRPVARTFPFARSANHPSPTRWPLADSGKPQEEPSAGKPLARICEGKSRMG